MLLGSVVVNLSVIIPVYNAKLYLGIMVQSILDQKFDGFEIILIDDFSTDGSHELCDSLSESDDRIMVYHLSSNHGPSYARNFGLSKATGKYIHFADADDMIEHDMYSDFYDIVESYNPDMILCRSNQINLKQDKITIVGDETSKFLSGKKAITEYLDGITDFNMRSLVHYVWNKWYSRSFVLENNLQFSTAINLGEDYLFNCQALMVINSIYIDEKPHYNYYIRGSSLVSAFQPEPWKSRQIIFDACKELYMELGLWESNKKNLLMEQGKMSFASLRSINSKKCKLNKHKKRQFIRSFVSSDLFNLTLYYLSNSSKGEHYIWYMLMKYSRRIGISIVIFFDWIQKRL